jgi:hypothetical protein
VTQNHKNILFLLCLGLCILQAKLESRLSHAYLSVTIEQFHLAFGVSLLNHIKSRKIKTYPPFHQLYTTQHDVQIQANQRLWLCIDPGRSILFTIISANLVCIGKAEGKANRFYWIRFNNSLQFFAVLSRYFFF